ncbi:MAG: PP2C family protein-serine/threonine phosphatase [Lachnospiraceae bacterium]
MTVTYYIIAVLVVIIIILELVKITYHPKPSADNKPDVGTCMTIGDRDIQEDQTAVLTTLAGTMAVLADGAGKMYGGRIAGRIAVNTCVEIFKDYNAFNNPQYYFRKAFHAANKEILKELGDENRGTASIACVLIRLGYLYYALAGNVKICIFREETLIPVSTGHTVAVLAEQKFREGKISRQDALELLENQRL